jgi:predicted nucleic-acid-binding protein
MARSNSDLVLELIDLTRDSTLAVQSPDAIELMAEIYHKRRAVIGEILKRMEGKENV